MTAKITRNINGAISYNGVTLNGYTLMLWLQKYNRETEQDLRFRDLKASHIEKYLRDREWERNQERP